MSNQVGTHHMLSGSLESSLTYNLYAGFFPLSFFRNIYFKVHSKQILDK